MLPHPSNPVNYSVMTSTTTLRNHLTTTHLSVYIEVCGKNGWDERLKAARTSKTSLTKDVVRCETPEYSKEALLKGLIAFVVADDQVREHSGLDQTIGF